MSSPSPAPQTITILGAGAWGSTLAQLAQAQGHRVRVWDRRNSLSLATALSEAQIVISALSMAGVNPVVEQIQQIHSQQPLPPLIWVSATKGLDPQTRRTPAQIWQQAFPGSVVVLSGPNLAKEIQQGLPAATVVASTAPTAAQTVQLALSSDRFRVYTSLDPLGVELGGTLKNVIAIAVGACEGLHLGTNAKAALVTRGLREIVRVGTYLGAEAQTFTGLSGLGDLLATCNSSLSRNYRVGFGLAQGKSLGQILQEIEGTAEGVNTAHVLMDLAEREGISVPISEQVCQVLRGQITPQRALEVLMERAVKPE